MSGREKLIRKEIENFNAEEVGEKRNVKKKGKYLE